MGDDSCEGDWSLPEGLSMVSSTNYYIVVDVLLFF